MALPPYPDRVREFRQQLIVPPAVYEARLWLGFKPEEDHCRMMFEIVDPTTDVLLAMRSKPHLRLEAVEPAAVHLFDGMLRELTKLGVLPDPFPDRSESHP